jgi:hypothetical protein
VTGRSDSPTISCMKAAPNAAPAATATDRITVALIPKAAADLEASRGRSGLSKTDVVNRALSLYEFITARIAAGDELVLRAVDGTAQLVRLL